MKTIRPAIDLIDGQCVRLSEGDYAQKTVYETDPLAMARRIENAGLRRLHLVDLDGAKAGEPRSLSILKRLATQTGLLIDYGGGLKTRADVQAAFDAGANQVNLGSLAARAPETFLAWLNHFGAERLILSADAREGQVAVGGWQQTTALPVVAFISDFAARGVRHVVCTDIRRDGRLSGPALELYRSILKASPGLNLIASGGIRQAQDLADLAAIGVHDAIVGKALYEGHLSLEALLSAVESSPEEPGQAAS